MLADVDRTLVAEEKVLTKRAQAAGHSLRGAGIRFAIASGRRWVAGSRTAGLKFASR